MRNRLLLTAVFLVFLGSVSKAQIVGPNGFLKGAYLEIGLCPIGALGSTVAPPAGFHPHPAGPLAEVYDYGHDGWTTGAPPYMGDYTYPGSPFEGWEVQMNGARGQAYYNNFPYGVTYTYSGGATITGGGLTSYTNVGGVMKVNYASNFNAGGATLHIDQEARVDTFGDAVVLTVTFHNTSASAANNVYFWRSCDPDNDESWPAYGGMFPTDNYIDFQNATIPNPTHKVSVTGIGRSTTHPPLTLCTKDCRAVATIYNSWGLTVGQDLAAVWNQTYGPAGSGAFYNVGVNHPGDIGIGIVWNIGTIAPGDSAIISYAYVFNGPAGIDAAGALPDPQLSINGSIVTTFPDTFDLCTLPPGVTTVPVDILFGTDKDWSWADWTWSPGTGLSSTTGTHVVIDGSLLAGATTFTVTGNDSAAHMRSCNHKVFVFTIKPCHSAFVNTPCIGDALNFDVTGDSVGASYLWIGPGGFTSTMRNPTRFPSTWADTGMYHVTKTVGSSVITDSVHVILHPKPVVNVTSNGPLCAGLNDTLELYVNLDSAGETFAWTGPLGFASTLQLPTVPNFDAPNAGWYHVEATTVWGCKDTDGVYAAIVPPPPAPVISGIDHYCNGAPFVPFTVSGANILWYPTSASTVGSMTAPTINTSVAGTYTVYATQTVGCLSPKDSFTVVVYPLITPHFDFYIKRACEADTVYFANTSTNGNTYVWNFGDATPNAIDTGGLLLSHVHIYPVRNQYNVTLKGYINASECETPYTALVDTRHDVTADFDPANDTVCFGTPITFNNLSTATVQGGAGQIVNNAWTFGNGATDNSVSPVYLYPQPGKYPARLVVTDSIGCVDSITKAIFVIQMSMDVTHDTTLCISQPLPLRNTPIMIPDIGWTDYSFNWSPGNNLSDPNVQNPFFDGFGTYTYIVTNTMNGYNCQAIDSVHINSVPGSPISQLTASSWIMYGDKIQLNAGGQVFYYWSPNDGSLDNNNINNPIARPTHTTIYTVYGLDVNGCKDSAYVTVFVDTTMTQDIPSAFTPNNDGRNDVFKPVGIRFQHLVEFRIYNRWGQEIYYTNNKEEGWDGTFHGVPQEMGTYFYQVIVENPGAGNNIVYKGTVTLIR